MKKIILIGLALSLLMGISFASVTFTDLNGHWGEETIQKLVDNEVVSGYPDGTFRPENMIKVDEFIKLCISSLPDFSYDKNVDYSYWATPYISYALKNNIITSQEFPNFEKAITREEMALVTINTLAQIEIIMSVDNTGLEDNIKDYYLISDYMKDSVVRAYAMGLLLGKPGDIYDPKGFATRAEATVVIDRLKDESARKPFDFKTPYFMHTYYEFTQNGYKERTLKVLAPKDKNGIVKTDIIDLYNLGEAMKDKFRVDATVGENNDHIATPSYMYGSTYQTTDQRYRASLWKKIEGEMLPYTIEIYFELKNFMFQFDETPLTIGFHGFNKWSYYEEQYPEILDGYMAYIFGQDKDYVIALIDGHMAELMAPNNYSTKNNLNETYTLKNGRTVNMQSTGGSSYVIYIGNTK